MSVVDSSIAPRYIEAVYCPDTDGNCGFHCIAKEIYNDQKNKDDPAKDEWKLIKQEMLDHVNDNFDWYTSLLGATHLANAVKVLECRREKVGPELYFCSPEHPRIVAETFKRTVVFLSNQERYTVVPYLSEPVKKMPIFMQLSMAHLYHVKIKE
ncbi:hypothetical protein ABG067_008073, partial [Albugo candida]